MISYIGTGDFVRVSLSVWGPLHITVLHSLSDKYSVNEMDVRLTRIKEGCLHLIERILGLIIFDWHPL